MPGYDLLNPETLQRQYAHLLRQTIDAYDAPHVVFGEALQNALDAVTLAPGDEHVIHLLIDLDERRVEVVDDGIGFPNDPKLLFLGGSRKPDNKNLYGLIGAGLKVVLFSSEDFVLRARTDTSSLRAEITDAFRFSEDQPPSLTVPEQLPNDPEPLDQPGTSVSYRFPEGEENVIVRALDRIVADCLPGGTGDVFLRTLQGAVDAGAAPNRLAALLGAFLRRFTYVGDTRGLLGQRPDRESLELRVEVRCSDPSQATGSDLLGELFDGLDAFEFTVSPAYASVEETREWVPEQQPNIFNDGLGRGGRALEKTLRAFNVLRLSSDEEYEALLVNSRGNIDVDDAEIDEFRRLLYGRMNGIYLAIGRIPDFHKCLPGGSRRVVSANGVVTAHDLDFTRGRNQEYVRCFDLVIDVDARLNYGKNQITDLRLINRLRRYADAAYRATIQHAAGRWVGRFRPWDDEDERDVFYDRANLGLELILRKEPVSEQDVIALFFELAGRGQFNDYRFYGLSSKDRYDARAVMLREGEDPEVVFNPRDDRDLRVVEFKKTAVELVRDLERGQKEARDIALLVAWDEGSVDNPQYVFDDIQFSDAYQRSPRRTLPGVQRYLLDTRSAVQLQVLLLKEFVADLIRDHDADQGDSG